MKVRYIQMSPPDGDLSREQIVFTEEFDSPVSDWCEPGMSVYRDEVIDIPDLVGFPMEQIFSR